MIIYLVILVFFRFLMFDLMFVVSVMFLVVSLSVISILLGFGQ